MNNFLMREIFIESDDHTMKVHRVRTSSGYASMQIDAF